MQAAFYESTGAAPRRSARRPAGTPAPGPGEVRVRVVCSGVNPSDVKTRAGLRKKTLPFPRIVPHSDGAGIVDEVGEGVNSPRVGERVWLWNAALETAWGTRLSTWCCRPRRRCRCRTASASTPAPAWAFRRSRPTMRPPWTAASRARACWWPAAPGRWGTTRSSSRGCSARGRCSPPSAARRRQHLRVAGRRRPRRSTTETTIIASGARGDRRRRGVDRIIEVDIAANAPLDLQLLKPGGDLVVYGSGAGEFKLPFFPLIRAARAAALLHRVRAFGGRPRSRPSRTWTRCCGAARCSTTWPAISRWSDRAGPRAGGVGHAMGNVVVDCSRLTLSAGCANRCFWAATSPAARPAASPSCWRWARRPAAASCSTRLEKIERWRASPEWLAQPREWVGGFDFPFGLPRELVEHLGWPLQWRDCIAHYASLSRAGHPRHVRGVLRCPARRRRSSPTAPSTSWRAPAPR